MQKLSATQKGRKWIVKRYGKLLTPKEIIESLFKADYAILALSENKLVGYADIFRKNDFNYFEIGYLIFPQYVGQGYGYTIALHLFEYAIKNNINLKAECLVTNLPSIRLLEKVCKKYKPAHIYRERKYIPNTWCYYWDINNL